MDLPAVAYECKQETDKKRLAQYPVRVQKVKRLRRQITELNRALRREKSNAAHWQDWYMRTAKQTDEAISVARKANDTTERWEKLYRSADGRAASWRRWSARMGYIGLAVGVVGTVGFALLFRAMM